MSDINAIIEAMARATCEAHNLGRPGAWEGMPEERDVGFDRVKYRTLATAALIAGLTAMREPDRGTVEAGRDVNEYEYGDSESGWGGGYVNPTPAWQAMIDHLLNSLPGKGKAE